MMMAKEISRQLAQRAENIARHLFPQAKKAGHELCVGSIAGEPGQSLKVHLVGDKAGVWSDFAEGSSGDLLDLWRLKRNIKLSEAIKEAAIYLGISLPRFDPKRSSKFVKPALTNVTEAKFASSVYDYLMNQRKLSTNTIAAYNIKARGKEIVFPYQRDDQIIFIKYLSLDRTTHGKKIMRVESNCEPCLYGWHVIPVDARTITICEGELDCMTLYQYGLPALSVPFGGGSGDKQRWVEYEFDRLAIYDRIYLCLDADKEGFTATCELVERLGRHRCYIVKLPHKDANECLQANVSKEVMQQCFDIAKTLDPDELKSACEFVDEVINEFYPTDGAHLGYEAPWDKTHGKILFRPDELSVWTGINGHGKSQFLGQIILNLMKQGARVCIASLELKPKRLLMRLARQAGALSEITKEYLHAIHEWYEGKLWLFDLVGTAKSERLLEVFLYARQRYGIDVFVIDSFMKLDIAEDDYKSQKALMERLCDFKNQHGCHIHIVVHPRKGADESHPPGKLDNKGTGAISDLADNCFSVWRNKEKELLKQMQNGGAVLNSKQLKKLDESDCLWGCDKQRNGDWEGRFGFWFDPASLQYLDKPNLKPTRVVEYSNRDM